MTSLRKTIWDTADSMQSTTDKIKNGYNVGKQYGKGWFFVFTNSRQFRDYFMAVFVYVTQRAKRVPSGGFTLKGHTLKVAPQVQKMTSRK